ncbi:MAG: hypothetical protein IJF68_05465 [Opitutales bacterium]|nr:hypothetical protein [Opitutales bacterium]
MRDFEFPEFPSKSQSEGVEEWKRGKVEKWKSSVVSQAKQERKLFFIKVNLSATKPFPSIGARKFQFTNLTQISVSAIFESLIF